MWHNNIDYKIIVLCCNTRRKHGHWEVVSAEYIYLYWIYSANNSGIYGSWRVSVRPSGAGLGKTCVSWIYIFELDIFCQHLGDIWQLEGVCAPFGRWAGKQKNNQKNFYGVKLYAVSNCPFLHMVSNCPRCQIVLVSNCPVSNCPGVKLSPNRRN